MEGRSDGCITNAAGQGILPVRPAVPPAPPAEYKLANYNQLASTLTYIDSASVAGGVSTFSKAFSYQSGVYCEYCNL